MFSNLSAIDHSWSVLGATVGNCGTNCPSPSGVNGGLGTPCCNSSNCASNFCQCQFDFQGYGICGTAPVGNACTLYS